jgi:predicted Zn-dependent protease
VSRERAALQELQIEVLSVTTASLLKSREAHRNGHEHGMFRLIRALKMAQLVGVAKAVLLLRAMVLDYEMLSRLAYD